MEESGVSFQYVSAVSVERVSPVVANVYGGSVFAAVGARRCISAVCCGIETCALSGRLSTLLHAIYFYRCPRELSACLSIRLTTTDGSAILQINLSEHCTNCNRLRSALLYVHTETHLPVGKCWVLSAGWCTVVCAVHCVECGVGTGRLRQSSRPSLRCAISWRR